MIRDPQCCINADSALYISLKSNSADSARLDAK